MRLKQSPILLRLLLILIQFSGPTNKNLTQKITHSFHQTISHISRPLYYHHPCPRTGKIDWNEILCKNKLDTPDLAGICKQEPLNNRHMCAIPSILFPHCYRFMNKIIFSSVTSGNDILPIHAFHKESIIIQVQEEN